MLTSRAHGYFCQPSFPPTPPKQSSPVSHLGDPEANDGCSAGIWPLKSINVSLCSLEKKNPQIHKLLETQESKIYVYDKRLVYMCLFIVTHKFRKYLWAICYKPGIVLSSEDTTANKQQSPTFTAFIYVPLWEHRAVPPCLRFLSLYSHSLSANCSPKILKGRF